MRQGEKWIREGTRETSKRFDEATQVASSLQHKPMGVFDKPCIPENTPGEDESTFWANGAPHWDMHRIGWAIAGACAAASVIITFFSVLSHCRSYTNRSEQRQIIRILYMPPVYAIISFLSYRFYRSYTYYSLVELTKQVTLSAFLLLLIEYVSSTASNHSAENAMARKDKSALPIPFCCWRYRPTKAYFMYTLKWSVLQYVIIRPLCSIAGIICEALGVLCESAGYNPRYANLYIEFIDFISITVALYGLIIFYSLTAAELTGRRPLAKFLCIKLIVMFTFYQSFVFGWLEGTVIKATDFWTEANISNGLNALCICVEMVGFSIMFFWAYPAKEYRIAGAAKTSIWRPLLDSLNYSDFALEIAGSFRFFLDYFRGRPEAHGHGHLHRENLRTDENGRPKATFGQAFNLNGGKYVQVRFHDLFLVIPR
ncbi:DUF300-domain-containing protein [Flagelloscypha sp. PMI_526]|nr:DUF300-domain-containing protein [Flagelloscypha sp. PMI_526]